MIAGLRLWPNPAYVAVNWAEYTKIRREWDLNGRHALRGGERHAWIICEVYERTVAPHYVAGNCAEHTKIRR